ncbi:MAG: ATP-binding protein [Phycisphaeraceae bacterium]
MPDTSVPPVILDDWLAVSTDGFASMNAGRPPQHLVKELLQNSLDAIGAAKGEIHLEFLPAVAHGDCEGTIITCRDDGCGIINLRDIRTIFLTSKTDSHLQRGRMGRGFKEMLCLALSASVESGSRKVEFIVEGGRRITRESSAGNGDIVRGTLVTMHMPWPFITLDLADYFKTFLPPANVTVFVDGEHIESREPAHIVDATLPTELLEDGKWIRPQHRISHWHLQPEYRLRFH